MGGEGKVLERERVTSLLLNQIAAPAVFYIQRGRSDICRLVVRQVGDEKKDGGQRVLSGVCGIKNCSNAGNCVKNSSDYDL